MRGVVATAFLAYGVAIRLRILVLYHICLSFVDLACVKLCFEGAKRNACGACVN